MGKDDTSLIRLLVAAISVHFNWTPEKSADEFYRSDLCKLISDEATGLYVLPPRLLLPMFEVEVLGLVGNESYGG
jgi:hypothetical protein